LIQNLDFDDPHKIRSKVEKPQPYSITLIIVLITWIVAITLTAVMIAFSIAYRFLENHPSQLISHSTKYPVIRNLFCGTKFFGPRTPSLRPWETAVNVNTLSK